MSLAHAFSLSIAGIGVTVECDDASVVAGLARRYRAFPATGSARLTARVRLAGGQRASALLDTGMVFQGGVLRFTGPGYEGFIDEAAGEARLLLSSAQPLEDVEYFLRVAYALLAFQAGGLLFHAAGIVRGRWAYLFFGHSGSGKTTVARLSSDAQVLNDDLVLLGREGEGWHVHSTPFWNPTQVRSGGVARAPLRALFHLVQDTEAYLEPLPPARGLAELVASTPVIPADPGRLSQLLAFHQRLLADVPAYDLHFLPDPSFWGLVDGCSG